MLDDSLLHTRCNSGISTLTLLESRVLAADRRMQSMHSALGRRAYWSLLSQLPMLAGEIVLRDDSEIELHIPRPCLGAAAAWHLASAGGSISRHNDLVDGLHSKLPGSDHD